MKNKEFKFKTNINCGGCIAKVKPALDGEVGIKNWHVDTDNTDKILTVELDGIAEDIVVEIIKAKGFSIENL
ncbi:MAG: heavy-metal-associated domain-containing protein [Sphingobacterium composti]